MRAYNSALRKTEINVRRVKVEVPKSRVLNPGYTCKVCKESAETDWKFCMKCGTPLAPPSLELPTPGFSASKIIDGSKTLYLNSSPKVVKRSASKAVTGSLIDDLPSELSVQFSELIAPINENHLEEEQASILIESINAQLIEKSYEYLAKSKSAPSSLITDRSQEITHVTKKASRNKKDHSILDDTTSHGYLSEVGSVSSYYEAYVQREKELRNLSVACTEELHVPERESETSVGMLWTDSKLLSGIPHQSSFSPSARPAPNHMRDDHDDDATDISRGVMDQTNRLLDDEEAPIMFWSRILPQRDFNREEVDDDSAEGEEEEVLVKEEELTEHELRERERAALMHEVFHRFAPKSRDRLSPIHELGEDSSDIAGGVAFPCYSVVSRLFYSSVLKVNDLINSLEVRFKRDYLFSREALCELGQQISTATAGIAAAEQADETARAEFEAFKARSKSTRTKHALQVADALREASEAAESFATRFRVASDEFDRKSKQNVGFVSATGRHITSDAHMDAIQTEADIDLDRRGRLIQELQAEEMAVTVKLRTEEATSIMAVRKWRPRHAKALQQLKIIASKITFIRRSIAARVIQKAARRKLLMYFRKGFSFRRNRRGIIVQSSIFIKR